MSLDAISRLRIAPGGTPGATGAVPPAGITAGMLAYRLHDTETSKGWHYIPPAALGLLALLAVAYQTAFVAPPGGPVAVLFSPASTRAQAWSATVQAGGLVIREAMGGHVIVTMPTHDRFAEDIKMLGAWAIMNPMIVGGCRTDSGIQPGT